MATYSFNDVYATISGAGGAFSLSEGGIAEEGITIAMLEDKGTMSIGADGTPMHSLHSGNGGTATVRLQKTSPVNAALAQMYTVQTADSSVYDSNIIVLRNPRRGDVINCVSVAFRKLPDNANAKDGGMMDWVFNCGSINQILGNGTPG